MTPSSGPYLLEPGTLLGNRYRLERRIATGGMATVWLAHDAELGRSVAVKVLSDVMAEDPSYAARFRREAHLAAGLSHPNLVRIFDFSGDAERPYLVMEYVEAGTLADRIVTGRSREISPHRLAHELLGALSAIHRAGVVHRDVKPSNVLLDGDGRARLTDFGIAEPRDATKLTRAGEVIGTLKYMAPEIREGKPATPRSDLYSCGVVLGECLEDGHSREVVGLVDRLTRANPVKRPASASEALALLDTARVGAEATPPLRSASRGGVREVHITGRRVLVGVAALALGGVVAALTLGGGGEGNGPKSKPRISTTTTTEFRPTTTTATATAAPPALAPTAKPPPKPKAKPGGELPPGQAKK